ncbi:MAG: zinc-dependent alcohol dehydrogenase family protein [Lewinellaceae bacterium]|nr:zinc-dependent alcohol dehydrogenase family protein [Lewinellaceae bacterium]
MKAMILPKLTSFKENTQPLEIADLSRPIPGRGEALLRVLVCGVCHTELDEIEGRTPPPELPVVLGHQVVGEVVELGEGCERLQKGQRVGVAWIYHACGECEYCTSGQENLCPDFQATGRDANGGYAEYMTVPEDYAYPIPDTFEDSEAAPLLCAGAIGYRSVRLANLEDGQNLGLTGFGGSGHLVIKMVRYQYPNTKVFVYARNPEERAFARELGAVWAGDTTDAAPEKMDAIIDTTPVWKPVVEALKELKPGGRLVINAIRKESYDQNYLEKIKYEDHLWMEREIKSVANVTRKDVREFLQLAAEAGIKPDYQEFPLQEANTALHELKNQKIRGAKVLRVAQGR